MYTPHTPEDIAAMLERIGVASIDDLMRVPDAVALKTPLAVPPALPEMELQRLMIDYAERNDDIWNDILAQHQKEETTIIMEKTLVIEEKTTSN